MKVKVTRKQNNAGSCMVCGKYNENSMQGRFYELADGTLAGFVTAPEWVQSYPGRVHGGAITAMLDEVIGRAINVAEPDTWAVTVDISVHFRRPTPVGQELLLQGRVTDNNYRMFSGQGRLVLADGTVAAIGTARYMKLPPEKIADVAFSGREWANYPEPDDPEELELPEWNE